MWCPPEKSHPFLGKDTARATQLEFPASTLSSIFQVQWKMDWPHVTRA